ncbi:recombination protein O N-terminal domain-containing protein, partial [bacterium]|nr:recombination protein O N-terminal domain-containing protein [bacterium]
MQNFTTDAINLKTYPLSDSDKIIVMYSKDKGLIKGVAKGVKRPKSKLGARMDLLVANKLMLYKGKNLDTICQAVALNTFNKT